MRRNRPKPPPVTVGGDSDDNAVRPARGKRPGRPAGARKNGTPKAEKKGPPPRARDERPRRGGGGGGPKADRPKGPPGTSAAGGQAPPPRKKKKKRKVRTKECVNCYTPHVTIHRVKITHRKQWNFICDMCWADRCVDNPHYEYGGLWTSGRVMPPESELYAQWLATRKKKQRGPESSSEGEGEGKDAGDTSTVTVDTAPPAQPVAPPES